jgi:hypothetical protein
MAMIGHIKEVFEDDGQITCILKTGNGVEISAFVMGTSGAEFHPVPGDVALCHTAGQEILISAIIHGDASTESGESLVFSRNANGDVVSSLYLKTDGSVLCSNDSGSFELKANGQVSLNGHLTVDP